MSMKKTLLLIAIVASLICQPIWHNALTRVAAKNTETISKLPDDVLEARILRIETGLLPNAVIKGAPPATMKLADRMQFFKVPGVSVAVINDGRIEWARG